VSTSRKAQVPGAEALPFDHERPREAARQIVRLAIEAYGRRDPARVSIPPERMDLIAGFTAESIPYYLGGRLRGGYRPLIDAIVAGRVRGVAGVVGCNTPRFPQDAHHLALVRKLIAQDVLVVQTGCSALASGKAGLLRPEAALEHAGPGLREVCEVVGIPPVLHMGSCVDNSRILSVCAAIVAEGGLGTEIADLPVAAAAPEAMSEKAITIGLYAVASGILTAFLPVPHLAGSSVVRRYLEQDVERETGGRFLFTNEIDEAARGMIEHIDRKRAALKLAPMMWANGTRVEAVASRHLVDYVPPAGVASLGCGKAQERGQASPPKD
jgi:carbon-monoxide dehydrogenase catalytic subunit